MGERGEARRDEERWGGGDWHDEDGKECGSIILRRVNTERIGVSNM